MKPQTKKMPNENTGTFSKEELEAMRDRAKELRVEAKITKNKAEGEKAVLEAIAKMAEPDRTMANRLHQLINEAAPELSPKTWYGMPAYAKDDKVICYFTSASKFKSRYATFGFNDDAKLDEGSMWPTSFALKALTKIEEARIVELVKKAIN